MKDTMQELLTQSRGEGPPGLSNDNMSCGPRTGSSYVCGTRLARIEFPRFNGENVNQWIYQCENYFLIDKTPNEFKVQLAIVHLEGKALQWHTALMKFGLDIDAPSWPRFTKSLIEWFGSIGDDPMVALMCLRQKNSVDAYHEEFDSIITRLKLSNDHILSCFLGGLKKEIQMMV